MTPILDVQLEYQLQNLSDSSTGMKSGLPEVSEFWQTV